MKKKITKVKKIHYIDDFSFSISLELDENSKYEFHLTTIGINTFYAFLRYDENESEWIGKNCKVTGDKVKIIVNKHHLPPGKLICHVEQITNTDIPIYYELPTNIELTINDEHKPSSKPNVDSQQSKEINKLKDRYEHLSKQDEELLKEINTKSSVIDSDETTVIPELFVIEDSDEPKYFYSKRQIDERFATIKQLEAIKLEDYIKKDELRTEIENLRQFFIDEISNYIKTNKLIEYLEYKVDKEFLFKNYYNTSESDNRYLNK